MRSAISQASTSKSLNGQGGLPVSTIPGRPSRYAFIDAMRGIAACLVLLQHSLYQSGLLGERGRETAFIPTWLELGETGVVAFFLVSGFVIA